MVKKKQKVGSIGITYENEAYVEAETEEQAILKLYDKWEHISIQGKVEIIPAEIPQG